MHCRMNLSYLASFAVNDSHIVFVLGKPAINVQAKRTNEFNAGWTVVLKRKMCNTAIESVCIICSFRTPVQTQTQQLLSLLLSNFYKFSDLKYCE